MYKVVSAADFQQGCVKVRYETPQIDICGDLVEEALFEALAKGLEDLAISITNGGNDEKDDKYDSYAAALRILQ